ncbi:MAG TPA: hypothetical protein VF065_09700 [Ilumatobacter sp.]
MTDDFSLLASTYLDGDATPDERARVEADASLLAEVQRLRNARARMLDARWFERPGDAAREATIAAALDAWDALETGPVGASARSQPAVGRSRVVSFERRRAYTRWLTAAAAVAAVAALGVVVAQSDGGGGDDDESSTALEAPAETELRADATTEFTEQSEPPSGTEAAQSSSDAATEEAGGEGADAGVFADTPTAAVETTPAADVAAPASAVALESPQQLAAFAAEAMAAIDEDTSRDIFARPCADDTFDDIDSYVATGTYRGRSVVIGIDDDVDGRAIAVDPNTCELVAEAPLP